MLGQVTVRLRALTDQLIEAAAHGASSRVAARLVELIRVTDPDFDYTSDSIDLRLPITQEELAQWAGLSREGAVKGIGELRAAGVLETGRRRMTILEPAALRAAAVRVES